MFTHRLLLSKYLHFVSKKSLRIPKAGRHEFSTTSSAGGEYKDISNDQISFSLFNVKKSLKTKKKEFDDGFTHLRTGCPVCVAVEKPEDVYINKTTGQFICPKCQYSGKFGIIEKFFTTSLSIKIAKELKIYQHLFSQAKEQYQLENSIDLKTLEDNSVPVTPDNVTQIHEYFQFHEKLNKNSLSLLNARFNETDNELLVPLTDVLGQVVGYKILTKGPESEIIERTVPESNCSGVVIYGKHAKNPNKAILVLNIPDLLALMTTKTNTAFVCLPNGLKTLPQECLPGLDKFNELTLWFNYDTAGWDIARNFAKKLDEKRCMFVRPTSSQPLPYKALIANIDIKTILAKSLPILHKAITTFSSLRQDVLVDLQNIDKVQGVKWKRYPTLNKYLKGHRKGELTILTGPTGCGKTTFMSDYSLDLAMQGVSTLWGSFEIRNTRLAATLLRQFAGKPLLDPPNDEKLHEFEDFANSFQALPIYFMTFHGEQVIKVVMEAIEHAQYVHDVHHVIIDNVQFMMGVGEDTRNFDRFWRQDSIIAAFRTFATKKNCHVTLVIHPRKEKDAEDLTTSSIFGGAKATQEADNVLIIQDKRLTSIKGKKYLQIAKNRYSGDLGIMPLDFDKASLSYAQKPRKKPETSEKQLWNDHEPENPPY